VTLDDPAAAVPTREIYGRSAQYRLAAIPGA
jgi:hypothetical protein